MKSWRRSVAVLMGTVALAVGTASPVWARAKRTTTTTTPPAPGQRAIAPGEIVNSWALAPAGSTDPRQPGDRPDFSYSAAAGTVVDDQMTVFNFSNVELTFHLYATDAFNNVSGQFDVLAPDKKPTDVGTWVSLPQENLTLPAGKQATFPFSLHIPPNAHPGDHVGAILAANDAVGNGPNGKLVKIDRRTGSRLYVRVAGTLTPELAIRKISSSYHARLNPLSGPVDVTYRIENRGNVRMAGQAWVTASGLFGLGSKRSRPFEFPELLPGQSVEYKVHFKGLPATLVDLSRAHVKPAAAEGSSSAKSVSRGSLTLAPPWTVIALIVIALLIRRARRAYNKHSTPDATPEQELQLVR